MRFPYPRAAVDSLTMHGGFGAYVLPLLKVTVLAKGFDQAPTDPSAERFPRDLMSGVPV